MKNFIIILLCLISGIAQCQNSTDSTMVFSGYVFDSDSVPIEGVYLLNCRNLKAVTTDSNGYFRFQLMKGDSLVIHHISYERTFIHANKLHASNNKYYVKFRPYEIGSVEIKTYERDLANFEKNMKTTYMQMFKMEKPVNYKTGSHPKTVNPYAPGASAPGFGINLFELLGKISGKKKR